MNGDMLNNKGRQLIDRNRWTDWQFFTLVIETFSLEPKFIDHVEMYKTVISSIINK